MRESEHRVPEASRREPAPGSPSSDVAICAMREMMVKDPSEHTVTRAPSDFVPLIARTLPCTTVDLPFDAREDHW